MTVTKYHSKQKSGAVDKIYNYFSTEFWLITANIIAISNWFMHPESLGAVGLIVGGLGLVTFVTMITNRRAQQLFSQFHRNYQNTGLLTLALSLLVAITVFNYATSPSQALILTDSGKTALTALFNGGTAGGTASTSITNVINAIFIMFKALFFIGFMVALYKAYEKYTDRAEISDVIKTPLVLLIVVGLVDGAATAFLG
jgi:uncharacterized membrane protein